MSKVDWSLIDRALSYDVLFEELKEEKNEK
jgi:hypothetical protein